MDDAGPSNFHSLRPPAKRMPFYVRFLASTALVLVVGTFVATATDFVRRHRPGIAPEAYLLPQAQQILLPGLGIASLVGSCAAVASYRHRRNAARG